MFFDVRLRWAYIAIFAHQGLRKLRGPAKGGWYTTSDLMLRSINTTRWFRTCDNNYTALCTPSASRFAHNGLINVWVLTVEK